MTRFAALAALLTVAAGCDKTKALGGSRDESESAVTVDQVDLNAKPDILFQVFGERDDPRMIPIGVLSGTQMRPIVLTPDGWRRFDQLYLRSGTTYTLFADGEAAGRATIRQGMWEKTEPLYSLPRCKQLVPLAAVSIEGRPTDDYAVEFFASTRPLGHARTGRSPVAADVSRIGRDVGYQVGAAAGLSKASLDSLDFRAIGVPTGATPDPTIVGSFVDPNAPEGEGGATGHVFVIADRRDGQYAPTFRHSAKGAASEADYRRYVDHLDLTGDGVDEILIEGWRAGGGTSLIVVGFRNGRWEELFRGRDNWCLD